MQMKPGLSPNRISPGCISKESIEKNTWPNERKKRKLHGKLDTIMSYTVLCISNMKNQTYQKVLPRD
jgi:hypothetical protein